jgi:hypothetical protein
LKSLVALNSYINPFLFIQSTHPIFSCLAVQIHEQFTNIKLMKMMDNVSIASNLPTQKTNAPEKIKEALWDAFLISSEHVIVFLNK